MNETIKPNFELDVHANISSIGTIESNIAQIKEQAIAIKNWYENLVITSNMLDDIKKEKAQVNKAKDAVATYRKNIVAEFKKPIEVFEKTAKETEGVLKDAYDCINNQVKKYEDEERGKIEAQLSEYFYEYAASLNIDFVAFENANINVTLSASLKKLKEAVRSFLDKVNSDLMLIDTQEEKIEILAEYKRILNVSQAIMNVKARKEAEARERERQEILRQAKLEQEAQIKSVEEAAAEVTAPVEMPAAQNEKPIQEEIYSMSFKVYGTLNELRELKYFLDEKGIKYDANK